MKLNGRVTALRYDADGNAELTITVSPESKWAAKQIYQEAAQHEKSVVQIEKWRKHRSRDQNAMLWALLEIMARAMGGRKGSVSPQECYLTMLEKYGKAEYLLVLPDAVNALKKVFRSVQEVERRQYNGKEMVMVRCFAGSSTFTTAEMSELLDGVLDELAEMDVDARDAADVAYIRQEVRMA